ncbi:MAG: hypothetical protein U0136_16410 [Bdellovibrionota bacterium]
MKTVGVALLVCVSCVQNVFGDGIVLSRGSMCGGSQSTFLSAYANRLENHCWRWVMYQPRECVYSVPELGRTFRFIQELDGVTVRGRHYELSSDSSALIDNAWVMPAGPHNLLLDETGPNVRYANGKMNELEKFVTTPDGEQHFVKSFVLIDGRVWSVWCQLVDRSVVVMPQPAAPETVVPRRALPPAPMLPPQSEEDPANELPLPSLELPPTSTPSGSNKKQDEPQKSRRREKVAYR